MCVFYLSLVLESVRSTKLTSATFLVLFKYRKQEAYLFSAALNELKTGSQVKSRNDSITLKSLTASLQRESDGVEQKMKEDMQRLQSDIQLEMNARKEETGTELQGLEMKIMVSCSLLLNLGLLVELTRTLSRHTQDLNSKFTILLGEVRTEIEATKWISTRSFLPLSLSRPCVERN
jgi:hypothetical protein